MSTLTSLQLSARPLEVLTTATLEDIRAAAIANRPALSGSSAPRGWGSPTDSESYLDLPPDATMAIGAGIIVSADDRLPRRLRLRYYWTQPERRAVRRNEGSDDWRLVHVLQAADVVIYETEHGRTALVTTRTPHPFKQASEGLQVLLRTIDEGAQVSVDVTAFGFSNDFFLWLFNRNQGSQDLSEQGLELKGMHALSTISLNKGARFKDGATLDRIELISLIAVSKGKFGPAKFSVDSIDLDATFDLELHLDGGFQPYRTSEYEGVSHDRTTLGPALIDDLWILVLPALRAAYEDDEHWDSEGRVALVRTCVDAVRAAVANALDDNRATAAAELPGTL